MTSDLVVIDASTAVKAVLPNPLQKYCLALVQTFADVQPAAPALWTYETTSAIAKAVHFDAITEKEALQALEKLDGMGVHLYVADVEQNRAAFEWTLRLKRASAYDSYYLVLTQMLECNFWTADKRLFHALEQAHMDWVHWIEELKP
jgi:predicted nucleic acid-binding protein